MADYKESLESATEMLPASKTTQNELSVSGVRISATVMCDELRWDTDVKYPDGSIALSTLKSNLKNYLLFNLPNSDGTEELSDVKLNWNPAPDVNWALDFDWMTIDYLCHLAQHLDMIEWSDRECVISGVYFTCWINQAPDPSLVDKILSLGLKQEPCQLSSDIESAVRSQPGMLGARRMLYHYATEEASSCGVETPENALSDLVLTTNFLDQSTQIGKFCADRKVKSMTGNCVWSNEVDTPLKLLLSGFQRNIRVDSNGGEKWSFLEAALFYGYSSGQADIGCPWHLSKIQRSPYWDVNKPSSPNQEWELSFNVPISHIPRHTRLCIAYCYIPRIPKSTTSRRKFFFEIQENGSFTDHSSMYAEGVSCRHDSIVDSYLILPLFDASGNLIKSWQHLLFWNYPSAESSTTLLHSPIGSVYQPIRNEKEHQRTDNTFLIASIQHTAHSLDSQAVVKYRGDENIRDPMGDLSVASSQIGQKLQLHLKTLDWSCKNQVDELEMFLEVMDLKCGSQPLIPLQLCLQFLTYKYAYQPLRDFAVKSLELIGKRMIRPLMSCLVQALKFENSVNSKLVQFLFRKCVNDSQLGYQLCWFLLVECENTQYRSLYLPILQVFVKSCKASICRQFLKALLTDREMTKWATSVQTAYHKYSPEAAHHSLIRNIAVFEGLSVPFESANSCFYAALSEAQERAHTKGEQFKVPLCNLYNPRDKVVGIDANGCKIMNSKKLPLWLKLKRSESISKQRSPDKEKHPSPSRPISCLVDSSPSEDSSKPSPKFQSLDLPVPTSDNRNPSPSAKPGTDPFFTFSDYPSIGSSDYSGTADPVSGNALDNDMIIDCDASRLATIVSPNGLDLRKSLKLFGQSRLSMDKYSSKRNDSIASLASIGPDECSNDSKTFNLTNFHLQTLKKTQFQGLFDRFNSRNFVLYDIRWSSVKTRKTEAERARSSSTRRDAMEFEIVFDDMCDESRLEPSDNFGDLKMSALQESVILDPVGFIEDSFTVIEMKVLNRQSKIDNESDDNEDASTNGGSASRPFLVSRLKYQLSSEVERKEVNGGKGVDAACEKKECEMIYKAGDDLRQDAFIMQVFDLMLNIWKSNPVTENIILKTYGCIATSQNTGAIEVVQEAVTLCRTQKIYNVRLNRSKSYWDKDSLKKWLEENNDPRDMPKVYHRFFWSALGSCVATFILGIGDRHSDNMMIRRDGTFLHIDFGHMLGNFKKFKMIARETTPFFFTPDIVEVLGGFESANYIKFKTHFVNAYSKIRENAHLFISLFELMLSAGLPELRVTEHINFLTEKTLLVNEEDKAIQPKIMAVVDAAAANQRQILNQKIHQLK